ncbi:LOW QUALITY PROTEIN: hypothetical protein V2J09_001947 [Rumex salicifolius]
MALFQDLCANLMFLDIQHNKLSGKIPDCWENSAIVGLELSSNKLSGQTPNTLTKSGMVMFLSLGDNLLEGELPTSLGNCTDLMVLNVGNFTSLQILILRQNRFSGVIPPQLCSLHKLQIIDLGSNKLVGTVPPCFGHFEGMSSVQNPYSSSSSIRYNLQKVMDPNEWSAAEVIKGKEIVYTSVLHLVVNMDLSCNNLVGVIPVQITNLSLLGFLNLSYNHLNGTIPKEIFGVHRLVIQRSYRINSREHLFYMFLVQTEFVIQQPWRTNPNRKPTPNSARSIHMHGKPGLMR